MIGSVGWSLKTRVIAMSTAILLVCVAVASLAASHVLRGELVELVGQQQLATVAVLADTTQREVRNRLDALEQSAARLGAMAPADSAAIQRRLSADRPAAQMFNGGLFATGPSGIVIAATSGATAPIGQDYRSQDAVAAALASGEPQIMRLTPQARGGAPEIAMAVPMRTAQGRVAGVLVGVTDLAAPNFLDAIVSRPHGEAGGFFVVAPRQRMIITSTDRSRVFETLPPAGQNAVIDRIVAG